MQIEVIALTRQRYGGKWIEPGDEFLVSAQDATTLSFIKRVRRKNMTADAPAPARVKRPYRRRDLTGGQINSK